MLAINPTLAAPIEVEAPVDRSLAQNAALQISPLPAPAAVSATNNIRRIPFEVTVNSAQSGTWVLLEKDGVLYAPWDAFEEWRVQLGPKAVPFIYQGQNWYALSAIAGFEAQLNFANQSINLKFLPQAFAATRLSQTATERPPVTPATPSAFLNYDLNYNRSSLRSAGSNQDLGALLEFGASNTWGVLTSSYAARNLISSDPLSGREFRRLETTFTRDFPEKNLTLRLGDSTTRSGSWGRSVYFGGVQLSRNFGLTPGFIAQPLPVVKGLSSAPSTVELYINDALRQTSQVPTGPFAIDNFPLLTGSGQARIVVRDVLGRETVLVQDFFSHSSLLEEGLSDWSVEAGAVRKELGISNAVYGQSFSSGLWRYGLSKSLTLETRGEVGRDTQGTGVGLVRALPANTLGQIATAFSHDDVYGDGHQWVAGLEKFSLHHGFSLRKEGASRGYRQIGQDLNTLAYQSQLSSSYTYSADQRGSVGLGYVKVNSYDQGPLTTQSANYTMRIGERNSVSLSWVRVNGGNNVGATSIGVSLLIPLSNQLTVSSSVSQRNGQTDGYISANQGSSGVTGLSWRALAGQRSQQNYAEGGLYYQGTQGLLTADISHSSTQQTLRLGAQGGVVAIDGQVFASRQVQESFALVEVPGYADVGVGFQGSVLARTNKDGKALVPRLLPYQANSIRLDPSELPISAELDSIEQVVVPAQRSGVIVKFPVRTGRAALVKIIFDDDQPAPADAEIELIGDKQTFFVARRGEAFITGLQITNRLRLNWEKASCFFTVDLQPTGKTDEIARVGPVKCPGVARGNQ